MAKSAKRSGTIARSTVARRRDLKTGAVDFPEGERLRATEVKNIFVSSPASVALRTGETMSPKLQFIALRSTSAVTTGWLPVLARPS
jgi:hypothetical protein